MARNPLAKAILELAPRFPAQFAFDLACIDGVAPIVPEAVGDKGDLGCVGTTVGFQAQLVEQLAQKWLGKTEQLG